MRGETKVVSTESCTPPQRGSSLAITSIRRSSWRGVARFRSRTRTLAATVAPAPDTYEPRHARGACRDMVTGCIVQLAASAACCGKRQREAQEAEQEDAEQRRVQGQLFYPRTFFPSPTTGGTGCSEHTRRRWAARCCGGGGPVTACGWQGEEGPSDLPTHR